MNHLWEVVDVATKAPSLAHGNLTNSTSTPAAVSTAAGRLTSHHKYDERKTSAPLPLQQQRQANAAMAAGRKNFFEGFKHSLRPRTKSDDLGDGSGPESSAAAVANQLKRISVGDQEEGPGSRRWSETANKVRRSFGE